jgi:ABC-type nitrate/sulfonate/bicarbonate transport system substrate-binding protein
VAFLVHTGFATAAPMAEGADLVAIAAVIHRHTAQVYGAPGVETPQALRGGRLGIVGPGTLSHLAAHTILRDWGLKPEQDVALLSLRGMPEILTGLLTGAVDAGVLTEPIAFAASKQGLPLIADLRDSPAEYLTTGVFTTREYVRQNRALVLNFLRGYAEGLKRYFDDKPFAIETLRQYVRMDDPVVLDQTYALYAESFFVRIPVPTARGMQHVLDDYAQVNPKAREVDAARLVDASLVQELQREGFFRTLGLE